MANTTQLELMGDVSLEAFFLEMSNKAGINLVDSITNARIQRTIEGASTLTVDLDDDLERTIQKSGRLGRHVNVTVDGLVFTLVAANKLSRAVTLTFEDRVVNALRYFDSWKFASRSKMTRAQFVLSMILEARQAGVPIRYVIPELNKKELVSDLLPGEVFLDPKTAKPITSKSPQSRPGGIPQGVPLAPSHALLNADNQPATPEQIGIANTVISVGVSMGARRKVLVASIMTALDESNLTNLLPHPDPDAAHPAIGVFSQHKESGWPASRDVEVDARAFFNAAITEDRNNPNLSYNDLCWNVQHPQPRYPYAQYQDRAEKFVNEYGITGTGPGGTGDMAADPSYYNNSKPPSGISAGGSAYVPQANILGSGDYQFYRGNLTQDPGGSGNWILKKENSWDCMGRLANEVNWRRFCVSGFIYFVSDQYLFRSKPFMVISEDSDGIDWIDYNYDEGKRVATITVTCHIKRWSAPPGSIVRIFDMGIPNGNWLVNDVARSLFDDIGTITLKKPLPILPEPTASSQAKQFPGAPTPVPTPNRPPVGSGTPGPTAGDDKAANACAQKALDYARSKLGDPYQWGTEGPNTFDCSGLTQAAYETCASLPHNADMQLRQGPKVLGTLQAGDLVFFGENPGDTVASHCGIYIGSGQFIHAPHTGDVVKISDMTSGWYKDRYIGATRPSLS